VEEEEEEEKKEEEEEEEECKERGKRVNSDDFKLWNK